MKSATHFEETNDSCIRVAAIQFKMGDSPEGNLDVAEDWIRKAAADGAKLMLLPELFEGPYFCRLEDPRFFEWAAEIEESLPVQRMRVLARELGVFLPVSFFEKAGTEYYNSLAMVNARGEVSLVYRKSHIPDGPGYEEKYYFRPGNTGFRTWKTGKGTFGCAICWDQWFPEVARILVLGGAEILLYPTAIGSEPAEPELDTSGPWQRVMQGHAVANCVPVVAANRIGNEGGQVFYGNSFICDQWGAVVAQLPSGVEGWIAHTFDLAEIRKDRASMGFFRDRRTELYRNLLG